MAVQQSWVVREGRLCDWQISKLLLHEQSVHSPGQASSPRGPLWHSKSGFLCWQQGYRIQVDDTLFSSLMGEFPSHLHIVVGLFESLLEGHYVCGVVGPGVYAHQLVGMTE